MKTISIVGEIIHCDNCGKSLTIDYEERKDGVYEYEEMLKKYYKPADDSGNGYYFCQPRGFLCEECAKKDQKVIVLTPEDPKVKYFELMMAFEELKYNFAKKIIEPFEEKFKGGLSVDFIQKLDPMAYEALRNAKHFGIKKEKHRIAKEYVKHAKKTVINYLNLQLYNDDLMNMVRKQILELQIDIIYLRRQLEETDAVYIPVQGNPKFYEYSFEYTNILENACADGSNVGYSGDDYLVQELFDKMAEKMLKLDVWREEA